MGNTCSNDEKKCPTGQGQGAMDKPFAPCADGSKCVCPGGGANCQFHYRVCGNGQGCRKMCRQGQPHCSWWTKNRNKHNGIREFNTGDSRPGNKGHNWGPDFAGNQLEDIIMLSFRIRLWYLLANVSCQRARNMIGK